MAIIKMTFGDYDELEKEVQTRIAEEYEKRKTGEISNTLMLLISKNGEFPTVEQLSSYEAVFAKKPELFLPYLIFFGQEYEPPKGDITFDYDEFEETKKYLKHYLNDAVELTENFAAQIKMTFEAYDELEKDVQTRIAEEYKNRQTGEISDVLKLLISSNGEYPTADQLSSCESEIGKKTEAFLPYLIFFAQEYEPSGDDSDYAETKKYLTRYLNAALVLTEEEPSGKHKEQKKPTVTRKRYNSLIKQAKRVETQRQMMRQTDVTSEVSLKTYFSAADKMVDEEHMIGQMMAQIDSTNVVKYLPMLLYYYTAYCPPETKEMQAKYKQLKTNIGLLLDMIEIVEE